MDIHVMKPENQILIVDEKEFYRIKKKSENIIDVAYDMLCWCIENGHLETNK